MHVRAFSYFIRIYICQGFVIFNDYNVYHGLDALVLLWPRRYGIASLLCYASYLGHFQTHSIVNEKLFVLTVLESGAPLSSFLEEVLYKSLNEWIMITMYVTMHVMVLSYLIITMYVCQSFVMFNNYNTCMSGLCQHMHVKAFSCLINVHISKKICFWFATIVFYTAQYIKQFGTVACS